MKVTIPLTSDHIKPSSFVPPPPPPEDGSAAYILRFNGLDDLPCENPVDGTITLREYGKKGYRGVLLRKVDGKLLSFTAHASERVKTAYVSAKILQHTR